nr:hypothetical protein [uncultured Blautia sp.]
MDQLEKVEKLRERANVSYEEAKEALEASGWDLLDAMVYLEKNGKVETPEQETASSTSQESPQYVSVKEKVEEQEKESEEGILTKLVKVCKVLFRMSKENSFCVKRHDKELIRVPAWVLVLALLFAWHLLLPAAIIALFFDCRYSFSGKDDLSPANKAMDKASEVAEKVKSEFESR